MRGMRPLISVLALAGSALLDTVAQAGDAAPIRVQSQSLLLPALPSDFDPTSQMAKDGDIKMPFVLGGKPGVAARINQQVWQDMLDTPAPLKPSKTWTPDPQHLPMGTMSLTFNAQLRPKDAPQLLLLTLSGESCGAYCENFSRTLTFDLQDGSRLQLADVVNARGLAAIAGFVQRARRESYQRQIRKIQQTLRKTARRDAEARSDLENRLFLNEDCLKMAQTPPNAAHWASAEVVPDKAGGLRLITKRCSNHAMRALDDVGEITVQVSLALIQPTLTDRGRRLLRVP